METQRKSKCSICSRTFVSRKFMTHKCHRPASNSTLYNKEDLKCTFCGAQLETPNLLEIHMINCMHRNIPQMCKLCKNPIRLRSQGKHYCANCSTVKKGNQEYGLRFKVASLTESPGSKSPRPFTAPTKNIENGNRPSVNCTNAESSVISARQRIAPMSDSQKQGKRKLEQNFADHPVKKKQNKIASLKVTSDKEADTEKQNPVGLHQLRELHHLSGKVSKSSERNVLKPKKNFKEPKKNLEVVSEKIKNNNSRKLNPKTTRQTEQKTRQASKKNDFLPCKNNTTNKKVTIQLLLGAIPENDCGMLLHSSSANKMDHYYKCCRCGKPFRNIKLGSTHLLKCKSNKLLSTEVSTNDVKWVCTICHSFFATSIYLTNHVKGCNILKNKYDRACERRCKKCNFRCLSSLKFEEHDCTKELKCMKTCTVQLKVVNVANVKTNSAGKIVMHECDVCCEIFDEQFTGQHFASHHPGQPISGNIKQYTVNVNSEYHKPRCVEPKDTVVVKSEPSSHDYENIGNGSFNFQDPHHYPLVNNYPFNPVPDNISMPPPPPGHFPIVSLPLHQSSSTFGGPSSSHAVSKSARAINQQICSCVNPSVGSDTKPCLKCLSKLDITSFAPNCKVVPFRLAKIKKEASEDLDSNLAAPVTEIGGGMVGNFFPFQFLDPFHRFPSLTPPSSHNGISPPATPSVQPFTNGPPDVNVGSLNDTISMVPDLSQIDEPRSPDELVQYINDDRSPELSLEQGDDQELFIPIDSCTLTHSWDVDDLKTVDTWAVVPSKSDETVEKYTCSGCMFFTCADRNVIINHMYKNHEKKLHYVAKLLQERRSDS